MAQPPPPGSGPPWGYPQQQPQQPLQGYYAPYPPPFVMTPIYPPPPSPYPPFPTSHAPSLLPYPTGVQYAYPGYSYAPQTAASHTVVPPHAYGHAQVTDAEDDSWVDEEARLPRMFTKGETPEEIEQWVAQRKKSFPTAELVARKRAQAVAAVDRGELRPIEQSQRAVREWNSFGGRGRGMGGRGRGRGGRMQYGGERNSEEARATVAERKREVRELNLREDTLFFDRTLANSEHCEKIVFCSTKTSAGPAVAGASASQERLEAEVVEEKQHQKETGEKQPPAKSPRWSAPRPPPPSRTRQERCVPLLGVLLEKTVRKEKSATLQCLRYLVRRGFLQEPDTDDVGRTLDGEEYESEQDGEEVLPPPVAESDVLEAEALVKAEEALAGKEEGAADYMSPTVQTQIAAPYLAPAVPASTQIPAAEEMEEVDSEEEAAEHPEEPEWDDRA